VGPLFRHFVRVVRDVAAAAGKEARLVVEGEDVEIDLSMTEQLRDSLTHMIRNAIDHGIEMPEARRAQGKDHCGLLLLTAFHDSGSIVIQLKDDGAGLNRERIIAQIKKQGFIADVDKMSDGEIYQFVFASGFSTAPAVTDLSGRGIGLDIVRRNIEVLRGTVQLDSEVGMGTTVTIRLPLTLAMIEGFSVDVDGDTYILPLNTVLECLALPAQERGQGLSGVISLRGEPLPYIRLRDRFEIGGSPATQESIVVVAGHGIKVGIVVDGLYGPRQTVIKPLNKHLQHAPGISGSAVLGNGRVAFIVDVASLLADVIRNTKADNGSVAKCLEG
jgi:two-component system chemotaxis sensor kinase CheA